MNYDRYIEGGSDPMGIGEDEYLYDLLLNEIEKICTEKKGINYTCPARFIWFFNEFEDKEKWNEALYCMLESIMSRDFNLTDGELTELFERNYKYAWKIKSPDYRYYRQEAVKVFRTATDNVKELLNDSKSVSKPTTYCR